MRAETLGEINKKGEVLPRLELGSKDSESLVMTNYTTGPRMLQEGLEPPTLGLLDPCSTKLSYQSTTRVADKIYLWLQSAGVPKAKGALGELNPRPLLP